MSVVAEDAEAPVEGDELDAEAADVPARRGGGSRRAPGHPPWRRSRRRWHPSFVAGAPIVGFTGANGVGKTLVAASVIINDDLRRGRPVLSTVPLSSVWGDSEPLTSYRQMLDAHDCTVFLDEVAVAFSSRDSLLVPREFDVFLQTLRHRGVTLRWTAPAWLRADVRLREVTQVVVGCRGIGRRRVPGSFWPAPLLTMCGALDTVSVAVDETPTHVLKRRLFVPQLLVGYGAYDTLAEAPRIGHPPTGGACVDCGGTVPREACSIERHASLGLLGGAPARRPGAGRTVH